MKLTALIPAHNDDYALSFCLASIVDHFDRILVLSDASTDMTLNVAGHYASRHPDFHIIGYDGPQLGWIEARNRLLEYLDALCGGGELLFWLDADDVLCEYNAHVLREIAEGELPIVRLQLCEMWGDFNHTTQRTRHYDRCHVFVNRRLERDILWRGGSMAKLKVDTARSITAARSPGPLFFHIKGVRSDRRLVERRFTRRWLKRRRNADPPGGTEDLMHSTFGKEDIHRSALKMLLHSKQDHLKPTYLPGAEWPPNGPAPKRPAVIEEEIRRGQRFEIVYRDGHPVDRIDHGWTRPYPRRPPADAGGGIQHIA